MTKYETRAVTIGDFTVTVSKAKKGNAHDRIKAVLEFIAGRIVDPGYGVGGERPDQGLPPSGGTKPVEPDEGHPDQGLPGDGGTASQLPAHRLADFLREHAEDIADAITDGTPCAPQPK